MTGPRNLARPRRQVLRICRKRPILRHILDYQDIGGSTLAHKLAGSGEVAVQLPDAAARTAAYHFTVPKTKVLYHVGFLGAQMQAGVRAQDSTSYGFGLVLHGGAETISPLKLTLRHLVQEGWPGADAGAGGRRRQGLAADLSLTLSY